MKKLILLLIVCIPVLLTSCEDDEKDSIILGKKKITIDVNGNGETLEVTANGPWEIQNIPDWLHINPSYGDESTEIAISAFENKERVRRDVTLTFIRGRVLESVELEQLCIMDLDPYIDLDRNDLTLEIKGDTKYIELTANKSWNIEKIPHWLTVSPTSGEGDARISIQIGENRDPEGRGVILAFVAEGVRKTISVSQFGLKDIMGTPSLEMFNFSRIKITGNHKYDLETTSLFINSDIKDKIYLGNLLSHNAGVNTNIPVFDRYTYNPITFCLKGPVDDEFIETGIPSWNLQDNYAKRIIERKPVQGESFFYNDGSMEFYTYKQLRAIGLLNLGVGLEELISGTPYTGKEMTKKYGMIFCYRQTNFTLVMDYPQKLIKEELAEADKAKGVSYVSSVDYGRVGLLIVESDSDSRELRIAINKIIQNKAISTEESNLIAAADINYVYYNNDKEIQIKKGTLDVINAYKDAMTKGNDNVYALEFRLTGYPEYSDSTISFSFDLP